LLAFVDLAKAFYLDYCSHTSPTGSIDLKVFRL
jgi:hypothetical protein